LELRRLGEVWVSVNHSHDLRLQLINLGGVIYPIAFRTLLTIIGFQWATRILGFIAFATLMIPNLVMKPLLSKRSTRAFFDKTAVKDVPFILYAVGQFLISVGNYIPAFYIPLYGQHKLNLSPQFTAYLLSIFNAASIFGRIIFNIIADRIGPLNTIIPCTLSCAVFGFAWIATTTPAAFIVLCALFGFVSGALVSLPAPIVATALCSDPEFIGTRIGLSSVLAGFGFLIGSPIAGAIANVQANRFEGAQSFCGALLLGGGLMFTGVRLAKGGVSLKLKI
jgi:MFS family permease